MIRNMDQVTKVQLNRDSIDEILERSFALSYKLKRYDMCTRIRKRYPVMMVISIGALGDDSLDQLTPFASIIFNKSWKIDYLSDSTSIIILDHKKIISDLCDRVVSGRKYKVDFQIPNGKNLSFSWIQHNSFEESMYGMFDVFINLENNCFEIDTPRLRTIIEGNTYLFKDPITGVVHLGCKDRVVVVDVLSTDLVHTYLQKEFQYMGFKKCKSIYQKPLKDALECLNATSYEKQYSDSFAEDVLFPDENYRSTAIKYNAPKRIAFQLTNEEDLSSFFILVDFFKNQWRLTSSLDQYVANNWVICKDYESLLKILQSSVIPNLFSYEDANIVYFQPVMSFFTFHFYSLEILFSLYDNCDFILASNNENKTYFNCHNGYCKIEYCKYGIYLYKSNDILHLGYQNVVVIPDVANNRFYKNLKTEQFDNKRVKDLLKRAPFAFQ